MEEKPLVKKEANEIEKEIKWNLVLNYIGGILLDLAYFFKEFSENGKQYPVLTIFLNAV